MMPPKIPCGLCTHLHGLFPGTLEALPESDPPTLDRDARFTIVPPEAIPDEKVYEAVITYYRSSGLTITRDGPGIFWIRVSRLPIFQIVVSNNFLNRRRITVSATPL